MQDQQKLIEKLDECKHFDKDNRYMAANDLCAEMLKQNVQFDEAMERRICAAFMAHLDDTALDVQGNAVKCIQKIATRIREKNLVIVVEKMAERVVEGEKETRDIYSLAIRSIINEVNEEYAIAMIKSVYPRLFKGMNMAPEVREECLDILSEIFKRFGPLLLKNQALVNKDELMKVIPEQLAIDRQTLRKRATNCMGSFAVILNKNQLHNMCLLLVDKIKKAKNKVDSFTLIQCFGQMARTVGNKIAPFLNDIFPILINFSTQLNREQSIDIDNEIVEASLSTFESLLKKCPKEIGPYVEKILQIAESAISYDPNYTYDEGQDQQMDEDDGEGWGSEFEDDEAVREDDDDTSWKVRRAAVKTIDTSILSRPELLRTMYQRHAQILVDRFKERDDNVKCNILEAFQNLLKSTVVAEHAQSVELELTHQPSLVRQRSSTDELAALVPQIIEALLKQLKSKNMKVRVTVMDTLAQLTHALHQRLEPYFERILPELEHNMKETQSYDLLLDTLTILRRFFRAKSDSSHGKQVFQQNYKRILHIIMTSLSHEYSKVVSEGLRVAGSFVYVLKGQDGSTINPQFADVVPSLYPAVREKLQKTDIDQEVKQCSIIAMASIITICHNNLQPQQISDIIGIYNDRLQNELTRDATLKAITKIALNPDAQDQVLIQLNNLPSLLPRIYDLLHKTNRSLHLNTLETLVAITSRYAAQFQQAAPSILKELVIFISDADLQTAALALKVASNTVKINPQANEVQDVIARTATLSYSTVVQGTCLTELLNFFKTASTFKVVKDQTVNDIFNYVSIQSKAAAMVIAQIAIQSVNKQKFIEDFIGRVKDVAHTQNQVKGALCIGELGKQVDLSGIPNIIDIISGLFQAQNEEVRTAASISLGNLSIGNPDFFLQRVFALVDKSGFQEKYLYLNTIREIVIHNPKSLQLYLSKLLPLLILHSRNEEEQIRNIVAESIGRLFVIYSTEMFNDIEQALRDAHDEVRATIVKSFKYASSKDTDPVQLEFFLGELIKQVEDKSLTVKKNALESLNAIVHNQPHIIKNELERLEKVSISETLIRPELITEVDLGPFKHKVDEGIPIRKAAYSLIDTLVEKVPERISINHIVEIIVKGLDDPAEECMILCLHILGRLISWAPAVVASNIEPLVDTFDKQFEKYMKQNVQNSEKAQNILRALLRVVEQLQRTHEAEQNAKYLDFFKSRISENAILKDMYEKIAATASQAVMEHY